MGTQPAVDRPDGHDAPDDANVAVAAAHNAISNRLMDSLLHDVRNPLNALSINLDVLTEKLRREQGEIPPSQEKNLKVMREQIFRVDGILRQFAEFMSDRADANPVSDLSEIVRQSLLVLGHECRRSMIKVRQLVEPDLKLGVPSGAVKFLALQAVFRAIVRAGQQGEVDVTLQREGGHALLRVKDNSADPREPFAQAQAALQTLCARCGAELRAGQPNELSIQFPLNS